MNRAVINSGVKLRVNGTSSSKANVRANGDQQQGQRDGQPGGQSGTASLTTEQRTHIRETVITRGPKVTNVNFSVRVGTVVPRTVHLVEVPTVLIEVYPQYRGRKYFVYQDEIIIVDDDMRIVAVLTV